MIIKNSIMLAFFGTLSILLGIVRDRLLSTTVGVGPVLDIYNASFRIPDLLYAAMLAFVTAGTVVPFLTKEDKDMHLIDPRHKISSISIFFLWFMVLVGVLIGITLPFYASVIVPGFNPSQIHDFIITTRLLLVQPIFLGIVSIISCYAQMKNQFLLYALSPLGYSLGIIFGILALYPRYGVFGLIYGVIIGCVLSLAIQSYSLKGTKLHTIFGFFSWNHIKELFRLAIPRTGTNILTQFRTIFFTAFATTLGPGALTSFIFAQRISDACVQIIQQSVTTASLPVLSREFTENRIDQYRRAIFRYVVGLGLIGLFVGTVIFFMRNLVIWLLYGNTSFTNLISFFLMGFLAVLPFQMMSGYFSIGFYSIRDTRSVFIANLVSTSVAILTCYSLKDRGPISLVYGITLSVFSTFFLLLIFYIRKKIV